MWYLHENTDEVITEWCPLCNTEVELLNNFKPQICPNCKQRILPCSMCNQEAMDKAKVGCNSCPLEPLPATSLS